MHSSLMICLIHFVCYWGMVAIYDDICKGDCAIAMKNSFKNQLFGTFPFIIIFSDYYPIYYGDFLLSLGYLPILVVTGDIYFYICHRPFHSKLLWQFHKTHHTGTLCVAKALDADLLEHVVANIGSFSIGLFILQYFGYTMNIYVLYLWVAISTLNTCISHSNGQCKYDDCTHYLHHKIRFCNYGTGFYIMDRLFNSHILKNK